MSAPQEPTASALEARLREDLKEASRARDQLRMDTLRLALNAFHQEEVARTDSAHKQFRQPLTEQDRVAILERQIKQRQEAAQLYRSGNRADLVEKEGREAAILQAYMPARLSDDQVREIVQRLIAEHGKDFRAIMPLASRETKGLADGKRVSEIVRELTG